ncbi:MAG: DUF1439 domain-containing protein [Aliidiomarina sp.]|uniref:DUF1439 domain-containing protein n=1 Tax=Aliidiomarina sp. TaxID=1872439 RepID=UPI0025BEEB50|nr:DUF1439 domain-containing protein [Aliidiomarina sp.]MCH8500663.1 DUF1439 domain-containing protein [Aliidiomarina sp.]
MRNVQWLFISLVLLFVSGCAQVQQLASYRVTEADLEQILMRQADELAGRVSIMGVRVPLKVESLQAKIGPDGSDLVELSGAFKLEISLLGFEYPVALQMTVSGAPQYNSQEKAIFVRRLNIINSSVDAGGYRGSLDSLDQQVLALIDDFLAEQPVYRLNPDEPIQRALMQIPVNMAVEEGVIRLSPGR